MVSDLIKQYRGDRTENQALNFARLASINPT